MENQCEYIAYRGYFYIIEWFYDEKEQLFTRLQRKEICRPSRASLTLTLSQRERESFSVPIYTHTTNKALIKPQPHRF